MSIIDDIATLGAIKFNGASAKPVFTVDFSILRTIFRPIQYGMLGGANTQTVQGDMSLTPPQGQPVKFATKILLGGDGRSLLRHNGFDASLRGDAGGQILIAAGGYADQSGSSLTSHGGDATCKAAGGECLVVALGGFGGGGSFNTSPKVGVRNKGGDGGDATGESTDPDCQICVQGGQAANGQPGASAIKGTNTSGEPGSDGGRGGNASIHGGDRTYALAIGGNGGDGGSGGAPGDPYAALASDGDGGNGGAAIVDVGVNSTVDQNTAPGAPGKAGGPNSAKAGRTGLKVVNIAK
jgi:hypothetical protein